MGLPMIVTRMWQRFLWMLIQPQRRVASFDGHTQTLDSNQNIGVSFMYPSSYLFNTFYQGCMCTVLFSLSLFIFYFLFFFFFFHDSLPKFAFSTIHCAKT